MRFSVSVPVLSVHNTVASPSVSIAEARRVRTWDRDNRHAPMTVKTVRTSGNSSGSIAIPSAIPASRDCNGECPVANWTNTASKHTAAPTKANRRTRRLVSALRRGGSISILASDPPILPISLRIPLRSLQRYPDRAQRACRKTETAYRRHLASPASAIGPIGNGSSNRNRFSG